MFNVVRRTFSTMICKILIESKKIRTETGLWTNSYRSNKMASRPHSKKRFSILIFSLSTKLCIVQILVENVRLTTFNISMVRSFGFHASKKHGIIFFLAKKFNHLSYSNFPSLFYTKIITNFPQIFSRIKRIFSFKWLFIIG